MRICVLGNSHVACLKLAWDELRVDYPKTSLTFFADRQNGLAGLTPKGSALVPSNEALSAAIGYTSGGQTTVETEDYDVFLVCGLNLYLPRLDCRLSSAVVRAANRDCLPASLNFRVAQKLRAVTSKPVHLAHCPQRAYTPKTCADRNSMSYGRVFKFAFEVAEERGLKLNIQPLRTLEDGWSTRLAYSRGSTRLAIDDEIAPDAAHSKTDTAHMNVDFGRLYLERWFETLNCPQGRSLWPMPMRLGGQWAVKDPLLTSRRPARMVMPSAAGQPLSTLALS
jgi:hypothetical protein